MDFATRQHVRRQIDAAARKREGLAASRVQRSKPQRASTGVHWTDDQIATILERLAEDLDCKVTELTKRDYRRWIAQDPTKGPSEPTMRRRLAKKIPLCPRSLV